MKIEIIVNIIMPIILFIGFLSYTLKTYYHFLYLRLVKNYPKELSFMRFMRFINEYFFDRFEIILPFLFKRNLKNLTTDDKEKAKHIEKIIFRLLIISIIGFSMIPLGIYLQNRFNIN